MSSPLPTIACPERESSWPGEPSPGGSLGEGGNRGVKGKRKRGGVDLGVLTCSWFWKAVSEHICPALQFPLLTPRHTEYKSSLGGVSWTIESDHFESPPKELSHSPLPV